VATDLQSFHLQIDPDSRLAAGVGGAAHFVADAAGLKNDALAQWQSSIVTACLEAFQRLVGNRPRLDVIITSFADRIEVALSHAGEDLLPGDRLGSALAFAGIDRVQVETRGGESVTRLTKYIGHVSRRV
jgi:hypothetical protein